MATTNVEQQGIDDVVGWTVEYQGTATLPWNHLPSVDPSYLRKCSQLSKGASVLLSSQGSSVPGLGSSDA